MLLAYLRKNLAYDNPLRVMYYQLVAWLAAVWYRYPARDLKVVAVTGTKGKTTTCNLIAGILAAAGKKIGLATTVNLRVGDKVWANRSKMTTFGRFALQKLLREMVNAGCEYAILEVSSIALEQRRLYGINVDMAVWTNLQRDHWEYHGGQNSYREAKGKLFRDLYSGRRKTGVSKVAVLNRDDPHFAYFDRFLADRKITYGARRAEVRSGAMELKGHGTLFKLLLPNQEADVYLPLPGVFNVSNALAASAAAIGLGLDLTTVVRGLENPPAIPGRTESIHAGQEFTIIVDYAHTVESLAQICALFKPLTKGKLILVFGCAGGGRDKSKRPLMGEVADREAKIIILTDDDPYEEDRYAIIEDIAAGIKRPEGDGLWKIADRREALRLALTLARRGDIVLVAGKGGEEVMAVGDELIPWNDSAVIRELLSEEARVEIEGEIRTGENKCFLA